MSPMTLRDRIDAIASKVANEQRGGLSTEVQTSLARIIERLPDVTRSADAQMLVAVLETAVAALLVDPPNLALATHLLTQVDDTVRVYRGIGEKAWRSSAPTTNVIMGLSLLLVVATIVLLVLLPRLVAVAQLQVLGIDLSLLMTIGFFGALGSLLSIMLRIQDFSAKIDVPRSLLVLNGFFKPIVGMISAIFVYTLLNSGIITINVSDATAKNNFAIALALLAGLSERFVNDIASKAERAIS